MDCWALTPGCTRLVLIRHGAVTAEMRGRCYGRLDTELSPLGRSQALVTARYLNGIELCAVYSSSLRRAIETAQALADLRSLQVTSDDAFAEIDLGELEGLTYEEAERRYPQIYAEWMAHPTRVSFPGGESFLAMRERVRGGARKLRERHQRAAVAIVSHGGVNRTLLAEALGMSDEHLFRIDQSFAAVSIIDYYGDEPVVRLMNGLAITPFLEPERAGPQHG